MTIDTLPDHFERFPEHVENSNYHRHTIKFIQAEKLAQDLKYSWQRPGSHQNGYGYPLHQDQKVFCKRFPNLTVSRDKLVNCIIGKCWI
jgi:hypothetical protein